MILSIDTTMLLDTMECPMNVLDKEGSWAYRLKCIKPQGHNNSDFFFNQTRSNRERKR